MKQLLLSALLSLSICGLFSCGGVDYDPNNDPVTKMYDSMNRADSLREWGTPKSITFAEAKNKGDQDKSRISIDGYVRLGTTIIETASSVTIQLWERKNQSSGDYISITLSLGNDNNQMQTLPSEYKKTDLTLKDNKGQPVVYGDKIRITGIYSEPYNDGYGSVTVQSFEKIEDTPIDFSVLGAALVTSDTTGQSALDGKLVYAEGILEIPSTVFITETVYFNLVKNTGASEYVTVDVIIGKGANMVEELPDNYGENDVKIHDSKDKIVGKKKVRVYGVWDYGRIAAEQIEIL